MTPAAMTPTAMSMSPGKPHIGGGSPEPIGGDFTSRSSNHNGRSSGSLDGSPMSADSNGAPSVGHNSETVSKSESMSKPETDSVSKSESVSKTKGRPGHNGVGDGGGDGNGGGGNNSPMSSPAQSVTSPAEPMAQADSQTGSVASGPDGAVVGDYSSWAGDDGPTVVAGGDGAGEGGQRGDGDGELQ
ncbi:hypothetical protein TcasGA2_TC007241 [Tribolium castaneum]|uniref:Uncharacterized protein n=1 Tax=Tribolium castaneum TaxID=7070 RepID=D2A0L1_TRICA|nr:hypothetical protein TcasGA2_TC007241 [Tribolium castaneum]